MLLCRLVLRGVGEAWVWLQEQNQSSQWHKAHSSHSKGSVCSSLEMCPVTHRTHIRTHHAPGCASHPRAQESGSVLGCLSCGRVSLYVWLSHLGIAVPSLLQHRGPLWMCPHRGTTAACIVFWVKWSAALTILLVTYSPSG